MTENIRTEAFARVGKRKKGPLSNFLRSAFRAVFAVFISFLFSGTKFPFDTYPLAPALVCSAEKYVLCFVLGAFLRLAVSYESADLYIPVALCVAACAVRYFLFLGKRRAFMQADDGGEGFFEKFILRDELYCRAFAAVCSGAVWAFIRAVSGRTVYDVLAGLFCAVAALLFTFLFYFAQDMSFKNTGAAAAGKSAFVFCFVYSLAEVYVFTVSLGVTAAYMLMLFAAFSGDGAKGAVTGLLVGLAAGGDYAVIFAFSGLAAGIFYELSPVVASLISLGITVSGGLYSKGIDGVLSFLPEVLVGAVLMTTAAKIDILPRISFGEGGTQSRLCMRTILMKKRDEEKERRAEKRAGMLSSLSGVIKNMSAEFCLPDRGKMSDMCREVFREYCADCPEAGECCSRQTADDIAHNMALCIMSGEKTTKNAVDIDFECTKKEQLSAEINERAARLLRESGEHDKARIFAFDYGAAAKIIADTVPKHDRAYEVDRRLTERLARAFDAAGISAESIAVCGGRKKYIVAVGRDLLRSGIGAYDIRALCSDICGGIFTMPQYSLEGDIVSMTLESARLFEVEYAGRQMAKRGETVCGDAVGVTESHDDIFYGFICDGMGSGSEAGFTSGICKTFLEELLSCGNSRSTTLEMLNMFISSKNNECFSTVDLLEIDLIRGTASFTKSGAAASYIARRGSVYKIASGTIPVGILPEVSAEVTEFSLCDGDVIVMCSDGVGGDGEQDGGAGLFRIAEFLEHEWRLDVRSMADAIISDAAYAGKKADDMSVCVYRIKKKKR